MEIEDLEIPGLKLIKPKVFTDNRGFFLESFRKSAFDCEFVQDNHSFSKRGVIRGMHLQDGQDKLIRVVFGEIYDVAVDVRKGSPTFMRWIGVKLDGDSHVQLFVPKGFAHGFCVLSDEAHVLYKVSSYYDAAMEKGFHIHDPEVKINWPIGNPILSDRDRKAPPLKDIL